MKIKNIHILSIFLLTLIAMDISIVFNLEILFFRQIITFLTLLIVPGALVLYLLSINSDEFIKTIFYVVGVSVSFIIFTGLIINWLLPLFHVSNPMSLYPIIISFNMMCLILIGIIYFVKRNFSVEFNYKPLLFSEYIFCLVNLMLPILAIFGAINLNNNGSNFIPMVMLFLSAMYMIIISLFRSNINRVLYPIIIFCVSLSVLLMLSLRSWYISGFDISMEYEVFRITLGKGIWSMSNFKDVYNACLSITILPTYLVVLLHIPSEYIYKAIFQIIFATTPVGIYFLLKNIKMNDHLAFLASLFYICTPWFIDPMTTLNRQEIAFFFFISMLLVLFDTSIKKYLKDILFFLFTIAMVVSHYSTTYAAILVLFSIYGFIGSIRILNIKFFKENLDNSIYYLKPTYIINLLLVTFLWFTVINNASGNVTYFSRNIINNLHNFFNLNARNAIIDQLFKTGSVDISNKTYAEYYKTITGEYNVRKDIRTYSQDSYKNFKVIPASYPSIPVYNRNVYAIVNNYYKLTLILIELFLPIGTIFILYTYKNKQFNLLFKLLILLCELLLVVIVAVPYISVGYNFDRLYMQMMYILAIVEVIGGVTLCSMIFRNEKVSMSVISMFYISVFLYTYGFTWELAGGKAVMWLNNFGYSYAEIYTHKSDVTSAMWISHIPGNPLIYSTPTGRDILYAYAQKNNINNDLFPSTFDKKAYVYTTFVNSKYKIASLFYRGIHLGYQYPYDFLNRNKNKIYSNGESEIYK